MLWAKNSPLQYTLFALEPLVTEADTISIVKDALKRTFIDAQPKYGFKLLKRSESKLRTQDQKFFCVWQLQFHQIPNRKSYLKRLRENLYFAQQDHQLNRLPEPQGRFIGQLDDDMSNTSLQCEIDNEDNLIKRPWIDLT